LHSTPQADPLYLIMADKKTYVPSGQYPELNIVLSKKPQPAQAGQQGVPQKKLNGATVPYFPEDEVIKFTHITFYDLGTRKQEDGSYLDIIPNDVIVPGDGSFNWWAYYHDLILQGGEDALTGGKCLKIPTKAQYLYLDADIVPSDPDKDDDKELIGQKNTRPYINELALVGASNIDHTTWVGSLPLRPPRDDEDALIDCYLAMHSAFYYNAFYTGAPYPTSHDFFRITMTPDPTADNVFFALRNKDKVFLTPIWTLYSTGTVPNHVYFARRLPVLPGFAPQADALTMMGYDATTQRLEAQANATLWAAINAYYTAHFPGSSGWGEAVASIPIGGSFADLTINDMLATIGVVTDGMGHVIQRNGMLGYNITDHPRTLVAIIVRKAGEVYYVWQNSIYTEGFGDSFPSDPLFFWSKTRIYHP
jgi:hypothetical protein